MPINPGTLSCKYCGKTCRTRGGLTQHINWSKSCSDAQRYEVSNRKRPSEDPEPAAGERQGSGRSLRPRYFDGKNSLSGEPTGDSGRQDDADPQAKPGNPEDDHVDSGEDDEENDSGQWKGEEEDEEIQDQDGEDEDSQDDATINDATATGTAKPEPIREPLDEFRAFCEGHDDKFLDLTREEEASIRLMDILKRKKAPLNAFAEVLEWHLKESNEIKQHETLKDTEKYHHRNTLLKKLIPRYNLQGLMPKLKKLKLPSSKVVAQIPYRSAKDCIVSLLTDPRFQDEDYLFWGDDPLGKPPEVVTHLKDLNTGDAFLKSHEKMITKPNQVLVAVPMYIDGATTGQFSDLPITSLKISLGIHKRETRDKPWAWRELGWVPQTRKAKARGKKLLKESQHLDGRDFEMEDGEGDVDSDLDSEDDGMEVEELDDNEDEDTDAAPQDFHTILAFILESFVELQRTGFFFDLVYKGKMHKNVEIVLFVPYVKCDTEEGDLLCGKYLCRTKHVKHVCRYCHCPMNESDDPLARHKMKTQPDIQNLVQRGQIHKLKAISQQYIKNAWYKVTFHKANRSGIHGACPSEMLHALLLGIFKYLRDTFFRYMGESSKLADDINGLATKYGKILSRQSDRNFPITSFTKGIAKGKLMATHYRGVILVIAAVLRSTLGRELLLKRKKFGKKEGLQDWTILVELLLEWEAYLCKKEMRKDHVKKLDKKHRYIMYILKNVARRTKGMGMKLMKFHAITHMVHDMLLYGIPYEFDTGSNESHHKPSKHAAKLTQRKEETFNFQTATRLTEFLCIELAIEEVQRRIAVWEYFDYAEENGESKSQEDSDKEVYDGDLGGSDGETEEHHGDSGVQHGDQPADEVEIYTGGTRLRIYYDEERGNLPTFKILGRSKSKVGVVWPNELCEFMNQLQDKVIPYIPWKELQVLTMHQRDDVIWHGHPNYRGTGLWTDWALVDWGLEGVIPCRIWCFLKLLRMPIGAESLEHGGVKLRDGVFAVVECSQYSEEVDAVVESDLFTPLTLELGEEIEKGETPTRQFYLADVEAFHGPCSVIPDIGGHPSSYFLVKNRLEWSKEFIVWLNQPHKADVMVLENE